MSRDPSIPSSPGSVASANNTSQTAADDVSYRKKMILERYEKAGIDLPIVSFETVLDNVTSATAIETTDSGVTDTSSPKRQNSIQKGRRFARFRNFEKIIAGRRRPPVDDDLRQQENSEEPEIADRNDPNNSTAEHPDVSTAEHPDVSTTEHQDGDQNTSTSYMANENDETESLDLPMDEQYDYMNDVSLSSKAKATNDSTIDMSEDADTTTMVLSSSPFDACGFCCPDSGIMRAMGLKSPALADPSVEETSVQQQQNKDKYVVSNMQLPEGTDDARRLMHSQSLVDAENSVALSKDTQSESMEKGLEVVPNEKEQRRIIGLFQGSRCYRLTMLFCCLVHLILIGLIIPVAMEHRANKSASLAEAPPGDDDDDMGSLSPTTEVPESESTEVPTIEDTAALTAETDAPTAAATETNAPEETEIPTEAATEAPCLDTVTLSTSCIARGSDILVYFQSCEPQPGDWVAIYESSRDPTNLLVDDSMDWLFTCGSQTCNSAVLSGALSFPSRFGPGRADSTLQVHLMRDGPGPSYSAFASSAEFRVVPNERDC
jgi:hypothetical protein